MMNVIFTYLLSTLYLTLIINYLCRLIKESTEESKARVKAEMDIKVLQEQVRALKKNNTALAQKSKEEATAKVKALEEVDQLNEKLKAMEARLAFLLNKVS